MTNLNIAQLIQSIFTLEKTLIELDSRINTFNEVMRNQDDSIRNQERIISQLNHQLEIQKTREYVLDKLPEIKELERQLTEKYHHVIDKIRELNYPQQLLEFNPVYTFMIYQDNGKFIFRKIGDEPKTRDSQEGLLNGVDSPVGVRDFSPNLDRFST